MSRETTPPWIGRVSLPTGFLPASGASDTLIVPILINAPIILNATVRVPDQLSEFDGDPYPAGLSTVRFRLVDGWAG